MNKYQISKIYKLVDLTNDDMYIGSTTRKNLNTRLSEHVHDYKRYLRGTYHDVSSFKIIEGGNYKIELVESYPCQSRKELNTREGYWINQYVCVNKYIAGRTAKQQKNIKNTCACGGKYTNSNKSNHLRSKKHNSYLNQLN